jgi:hypothetical protein
MFFRIRNIENNLLKYRVLLDAVHQCLLPEKIEIKKGE